MTFLSTLTCHSQKKIVQTSLDLLIHKHFKYVEIHYSLIIEHGVIFMLQIYMKMPLRISLENLDIFIDRLKLVKYFPQTE